MPTDYDSIREENIREYGQGTRHLSFLGRLYTDRTHFIFELLQNAEDAGATQIFFEVFEDRLEVTHNGRPFNEQDVRGVCGVGEGTKAEDLTQIGKFGIGFKSVYAYTATPEVHSGEENFKIENYVRPYKVDPKSVGQSWTTLFIFPFNAEISPETACKNISERLRNLNARTLLFLREIKKIEYRLPDSTGGSYLRNEVVRGSGRQVNVTGQNNGKEDKESWLIFERPVPVPEKSEIVRVEVSFRVEAEDNAKKNPERITKVKDSPLFVFFPTEKATRFGFLIQGPYRTTPSRDNIPKDDEWNSTLVRETATLLSKILPEIKNLGLLTVSFLETLPIRMVDFPEDSMFHPIVESVRKALRERDLLPADDGSFVSAQNAKLASAEWLRKLLRNDQLKLLFQRELKWIHGDITDNERWYELWKYMREELEIELETPDSFARKVDSFFFENQSDQWMIDFYAQLSNQKGLWKKGSGTYKDSDGPLRNKPFLRLQDNKQVEPFWYHGSPKAYLIDVPNDRISLPFVKTEITQDKDALNFLKELGTPELDHVAEVIEHIIPKYQNDLQTITLDEHICDIAAIEKAYETDSQDKKERIHQSLLMTPFLQAKKKQSNDKVIYKKPSKLYFKTDELRLFFSGNESIGFVADTIYSDSMHNIMKDLGVSSEIKVKCKNANRLNDFVSLESRNGCYRKGLKGFDPDIEIEGLLHALQNPSIEKSMIIWNKLAIPYSHCIKGKVLWSSRHDFSPYASRYDEEETISENFGKLLIDTAWLPDVNANFNKPSDIKLGQIPDQFISDERLAHQLGMKLDVIEKFAEEVGLSSDAIEIIHRHPEEFRKWKAEILARKKEPPKFPTRPVANPERRHERLDEQFSEAPEKEYEKRERSIRTTDGAIDPITWLRNQYTNENDQMVCQICKEEMPFRKRDGEYYFEKKEALSRKYFPKEYEAQYLALCPLCAAKYQEFILNDKDAMAELKETLVNIDNFDVPITLGEHESSIRFVETHYHDLKTIVDGKWTH